MGSKSIRSKTKRHVPLSGSVCATLLQISNYGNQKSPIIRNVPGLRLGNDRGDRDEIPRPAAASSRKEGSPAILVHIIGKISMAIISSIVCIIMALCRLTDCHGRNAIQLNANDLGKYLKMELQYFEAVSLFRRKNYEKCLDICNTLLQNGNHDGVLYHQRIIDGVWHLKMRALTQRVFVDDLETNDDGIENEELELERIATAARPGTSIKTAFTPRPSSSLMINRLRTTSARPTTGIARPGTMSNRPGSAMSSRPASRCGTARRVRITSASAYAIRDPSASLFQASRLNPTIYADRSTIIKPLFQFLFYHEGDPQKAYSLCEAVANIRKNKTDWWWEQQRGRCLIALNHPKKAEDFLKRSLTDFPHPDTYLLMCKLYGKLEQPLVALQLLESAIERMPAEISLRIQQARIHEQLNKMEDSVKMYRIIVRMDAINPEALACIAVSYFYDNQPEKALMYYRRILSMGAHSAELYCNIALCCLYGGQIDLVLPCFQRAIRLATTSEQRSDIWYNLSFVGLTTGDVGLTKRCLRLCLASDATNGAALNNLAVLAANSGSSAKAKSYLMAAQSVLVDSPEVTNNMKIVDKTLGISSRKRPAKEFKSV